MYNFTCQYPVYYLCSVLFLYFLLFTFYFMKKDIGQHNALEKFSWQFSVTYSRLFQTVQTVLVRVFISVPVVFRPVSAALFPVCLKFEVRFPDTWSFLLQPDIVTFSLIQPSSCIASKIQMYYEPLTRRGWRWPRTPWCTQSWTTVGWIWITCWWRNDISQHFWSLGFISLRFCFSGYLQLLPVFLKCNNESTPEVCFWQFWTRLTLVSCTSFVIVFLYLNSWYPVVSFSVCFLDFTPCFSHGVSTNRKYSCREIRYVCCEICYHAQLLLYTSMYEYIKVVF